jgi:hypothetical protein
MVAGVMLGAESQQKASGKEQAYPGVSWWLSPIGAQLVKQKCEF